MTQAKIIVAGVGLVGKRHAALFDRFADVAAIVDPAPESAEYAAQFGASHFTSLEEALAETSVDGLVLATPNQLHVEQATLAIDREIPVLIEKPIADLSGPAAELVARAESKGVPLLVGHHRRHNKRAMVAKSVIESGQLGRIVAVNAQFWLYKPSDYFGMKWRQKPGAGPVFINLIHDIDLLSYFCGPIRAVQCQQS